LFFAAANVFSLEEDIDALIGNISISKIEKVKRVQRFIKKAYLKKDYRTLQKCADFLLSLKEYSKALDAYRQTAKVSLIKKRYTVIFYCAKKIAYLGDFDEGEVYYYHAAKLAMRNADWFLMINVAKELIKIRRFKSADKWLLRAGYFVRRRKSLGGIYSVANAYKMMGYKYLRNAEYWQEVAKTLKRELRGLPN
jgi:tetratricopeptide (TPR) repeat protein